MKLLQRCIEPSLFAMATAAILVAAGPLLDLLYVGTALYAAVLKWSAIGLLGAVAGWRASRADLLAIVLVELGFYMAYAVLVVTSLEPATDAGSVAGATAVAILVTVAGAFVGAALRLAVNGQRSDGPPPSA